MVRRCTYPLTGVACVNRVYTEQAIFEIRDDGLCVIETFGTTYADLEARLDVPLKSCPPELVNCGRLGACTVLVLTGSVQPASWRCLGFGTVDRRTTSSGVNRTC